MTSEELEDYIRSAMPVTIQQNGYEKAVDLIIEALQGYSIGKQTYIVNEEAYEFCDVL